MLTSDDSNEVFADQAVDRIQSDVLAPWQTARLDLAGKLYAVLGALDPKVPDLLDGAWDDLSRRGPAAAEKIANLVVEVLDRTLRAAGPGRGRP
jgi:hypothetical protein